MNRATRREAKRGLRVLLRRSFDPILYFCPCDGKPCRVRPEFMPCIKSIGCLIRNRKP